MMTRERKYQITEFLELVRSLIDSTEFTVAGVESKEGEMYAIVRSIVRLQVAQKNLQFAIDGLQDAHASLRREESGAPAPIRPNAG